MSRFIVALVLVAFGAIVMAQEAVEAENEIIGDAPIAPEEGLQGRSFYSGHGDNRRGYGSYNLGHNAYGNSFGAYNNGYGAIAYGSNYGQKHDYTSVNKVIGHGSSGGYGAGVYANSHSYGGYNNGYKQLNQGGYAGYNQGGYGNYNDYY